MDTRAALIEGRLVRLREPTPDDLATIAAAGVWSEFDDFGPPVHTSAWPPVRRVVVERIGDGVLLGTMSYIPVTWGPNPESVAYEIGISLAPAARGRGFGTEAQRLLADHLFAATAANRVQASTDVGNVAEQRALAKAGFTREGVARGAQWRAGAWHDMVTYARLRTDP